jgi:hypothetical protein
MLTSSRPWKQWWNMIFEPSTVQYLQDEYSKIVQGKTVGMLSRMMSLNFMMHLLLNCSMRNISSKMERKSVLANMI